MNLKWKSSFCTLFFGLWLTGTASAQALSTGLVKKLNQAHQALENKDYSRAQLLLGQNPPYHQIDQAWWWRMRGVVAQTQGQEGDAIAFFQNAVRLNQFDPEATRQLYQLIGDLNLNRAQYKPAVEAYREANQVQLSYEAWRGLAYSYYMLTNYDQAIQAAQSAVDSGQPVEKGVYEVLLGAQYEIQAWQGVVQTTQALLTQYAPQSDWYIQQAQAWLQLDQVKQAAASLLVARQQNLLLNDQHWRWLAYLQQQSGAPLRAAETLELGLTRGIVKNCAQIQRSLLSYYQLGKAWQRAEAPLQWLIDHEQQADDSRTLVAMRLTARDWQGAITAGQKAQQQGVELSEQIWLHLVYAAQELGHRRLERWAYQGVLRQNPKSTIARRQLAQIDAQI